MYVIAGNIAILLTFGLIGWCLKTFQVLSSENLKLLSVLEVWVFLPAKMLTGFSRNFTLKYISQKYGLILLSCILLAVTVVLCAWLVPKFVQDKYRQKIIRYSLTIPNYSYVGYALVESVYGEMMMLNMMIFALPMSVYVYTEGYRMLTNGNRISFRKMINPVFVAILFGCLIGLTGIHIPDVLQSVIRKAGDCMAPVSMLMAGITIADYDWKALLKDYRLYQLTFLRLILIPVILCMLLSRFLPREMVVIAVILYAMPCGFNTIIFPKMIGEDCKTGAGLALISSVLCVATIPFCMQCVEWFTAG